MVHFSGKARKMNHLSSLCASEASAKSYFNTFEIYLKPYIKSKLLVLARASLAREGKCCSFFGQSPKNEQPLLLLRERSERKSAF
ncbi:MAG: hypothetical protein U5L45_07905 [Saprospiraceae bacterium]|nr:hypothetical protein [Saprospiraceae bacterium]